jgi:hypothetical protein
MKYPNSIFRWVHSVKCFIDSGFLISSYCVRGENSKDIFTKKLLPKTDNGIFHCNVLFNYCMWPSFHFPPFKRYRNWYLGSSSLDPPLNIFWSMVLIPIILVGVELFFHCCFLYLLSFGGNEAENECWLIIPCVLFIQNSIFSSSHCNSFMDMNIS